MKYAVRPLQKVYSATIVVLCSALFFLPLVWADSHHAAEKEFSAELIADSLYFLEGGDGGNIAVLTGEEGLLIVDNGYRHRSAALKRALGSLDNDRDLRYIINTHWHGDHSEGNLAFGQGVDIVAHHNVRQRLLQPGEIKLFGMKSDPYPTQALPNITYNSELNLHFNGQALSLLNFGRGHTDGDTVVIFNDANVVHMGDLFFNGFFPFVDVDNGGNVLALARSVETVLQRMDNNTLIIPGHGPVAKKVDLQKFLQMLEGTIAEVQAMKAEGLNMKQMQQRGLDDKWQVWAKGFLSPEVWIQLVAASL